MAERKKVLIDDCNLKPSAVLLPLFVKDGRCHIVFTKRTNHLANHKGEISFPGGGRHKKDRSFLETALRESYEEIGLKQSDVEILGELDDTSTIRSSYCIVPFVGTIPYPYYFKQDAFEVEEIFDLPIDKILKAKTTTGLFTIEGITYDTQVYEVGDRLIWGATARILAGFFEVLGSVSGAHCIS